MIIEKRKYVYYPTLNIFLEGEKYLPPNTSSDEVIKVFENREEAVADAQRRYNEIIRKDHPRLNDIYPVVVTINAVSYKKKEIIRQRDIDREWHDCMNPLPGIARKEMYVKNLKIKYNVQNVKRVASDISKDLIAVLIGRNPYLFRVMYHPASYDKPLYYTVSILNTIVYYIERNIVCKYEVYDSNHQHIETMRYLNDVFEKYEIPMYKVKNCGQVYDIAPEKNRSAILV